MLTYDDPAADIVIDTEDDVRIVAARNVRVVRCGDLYANGATIRGGLYANRATIRGITIQPLTEPERAILRRIRDEIALDMNTWHGDDDGWCATHEGHCGTTHCLAGGAQALSGDPSVRAMEPLDAGRMLLPNASYLFFAPQAQVEKFLAAL